MESQLAYPHLQTGPWSNHPLLFVKLTQEKNSRISGKLLWSVMTIITNKSFLIFAFNCFSSHCVHNLNTSLKLRELMAPQIYCKVKGPHSMNPVARLQCARLDVGPWTFRGKLGFSCLQDAHSVVGNWSIMSESLPYRVGEKYSQESY